ncbi:unnamed protein product, partial [Porites evermanni]
SRSSYIKTRENKRLHGHVVKKIDSTDEMSCSRACLRHSWCTSSNFNESSGNCELNKHEFSPTDDDTKLTDNPGTTFSMFLKGCLMTGCLNGGSCLFDEGKHTFACSCSQQWSGEKCEMEAPKLQPIGCYKDNVNERALPVLYANFRRNIDWLNMELTVNQCAQVATVNKGYEYFAVQYYGECYTGKNASQTYNKHGKSDRCVEIDKTSGFRVGERDTNFVYRIN